MASGASILTAIRRGKH